MAAKEGLELALENGYDKVILEVHCSALKSMVDNRKGLGTQLEEFALILQS